MNNDLLHSSRNVQVVSCHLMHSPYNLYQPIEHFNLMTSLSSSISGSLWARFILYCVALPLHHVMCMRTKYIGGTVEPLSNDHPHQRPSLLYYHISCDGQCFLFVRSLTDDHPSNATSDLVKWNFLPLGRPHRVFQNDCGMNVLCRAEHFTYDFNRWQYLNEHKNIAYRLQKWLMTRPANLFLQWTTERAWLNESITYINFRIAYRMVDWIEKSHQLWGRQDVRLDSRGCEG